MKRTLLFIQVQPSLRARGALCQSALAVHPLNDRAGGGRVAENALDDPALGVMQRK